MNTELDNYLKEKLSQKPIGFMMHIICGYPSFEANWQVLELMDKYDIDLVELQFPFSEPSADGILFVEANEKSLQNGTTVGQCFEFMKKVNENFSFKTLMMGYYNTVYKMTEAKFINRLQEAGALGYIIADLPLEESKNLHQLSQQKNLCPILLMTPTNTSERLQTIADNAQGFIYVVARRGVTGQQTSMDTNLNEYLVNCRQASNLPLAVGFGISTRQDIDFLKNKVELAIIGTASLHAWQEGGAKSFEKFLAEVTS